MQSCPNYDKSDAVQAQQQLNNGLRDLLDLFQFLDGFFDLFAPSVLPGFQYLRIQTLLLFQRLGKYRCRRAEQQRAGARRYAPRCRDQRTLLMHGGGRCK